jgi:hypothetical protein
MDGLSKQFINVQTILLQTVCFKPSRIIDIKKNGDKNRMD